MPESKKEELLGQFLKEFQELTVQITEEAFKSAADEDESAVVKSFSVPLIKQVKELSSFIQEGSLKSTRQQKAEINQAITLGSGISLAQNAKGMFPSIRSLVGKLGLDRIIKEIKKIIRIILDLLGIRLPKWLDAIINLIDEIFAFILSGGSPKVLGIMSDQEVGYLRELTALSDLQNANQFKYQEDDDED